MKAARQMWTKEELDRLKSELKKRQGAHMGRNDSRTIADELYNMTGIMRTRQSVESKYLYLRERSEYGSNGNRKLETKTETRTKVRRTRKPQLSFHTLEAEVDSLLTKLRGKVTDIIRNANAKDKSISDLRKAFSRFK